MSIFVLDWIIRFSTFWLQTLLQYHIYLLLSTPLFFLHDEPSVSMLLWYSLSWVQLSVIWHFLSLTLFNLGLAHTQTPSPAKVSPCTLSFWGVPNWFIPYIPVHTFPCYFKLIFYFSIHTVRTYLFIFSSINFYYSATFLIF